MLDEAEEARDGRLGVLVPLPQLRQALPVLVLAFRPGADIGLQHLAEPLGLKDALGDLTDYDLVEGAHGHPQAPAGRRALLQFARAAVVSVGAALSGVLDQSRPAIAAAREAGQEGRAVRHARRKPLGVAALHQAPNRVERLLVDDGRHFESDPLGRRARRSIVPAVMAVEEVRAVVSRRGQQAVDASGREAPASAQNAALVEVRRDCLHSDRTPLHAGRHRERLAHDASLVLVNDENFFVFGPAPLLDLGAIAERSVRPVPEALAGILAHGPMHVFRVLARLVLVEDIQDFADEVTAARVLADVLRDRDQLNASLAELPDIKLRMQGVAAETAQRMDDDILERLIGTLRLVDHLLKHGAIIIERGRAGFRKNVGDLPTLALAVGSALGNLVGHRQVALSLA